MNIKKKILGNLTKCYSIAPLRYMNKDFILVGAEKDDPCYLFDLEGNKVDTVWEAPGGTMSMVQVPGSNGQFLATHKFYSPNDSKEAKIVVVTPNKDSPPHFRFAESGEGRTWKVDTLVDLPFVHRFDLLECGETTYLIACTLKSGHEYKEDWTCPGQVFVAELPKDLSQFNKNNQLELTVIKDGLTRNHGYCRVIENGKPVSLVTAQEGVYLFVPPTIKGGKWKIEKLLDTPASDAVFIDFDGDGERELGIISPFHGEKIEIYKKKDGDFEKVFSYGKPAEFSHAIYGGVLCGKPSLVIGHRQGERNLISFTYNAQTNTYDCEFIDTGCGPANIFHFENGEKDVIIATNREIDEIAMYTISI